MKPKEVVEEKFTDLFFTNTRGRNDIRREQIVKIIFIAQGECEHEEQNIIVADCVVCRMKVAEKGLTELKKKVVANKGLLEELVLLLQKHAGETGKNEGAIDVLKRLSKLAERVNEENIVRAIYDCCGIKEQGGSFESDARIWKESCKNISEIANAIIKEISK